MIEQQIPPPLTPKPLPRHLRKRGPIIRRKVNVQDSLHDICVDILTNNALETVSKVDLEKYLGKWYEIAHLPAKFQEGCNETTATYSLLGNGNISVLNECKKNGKAKLARGKAKVVDKTTNAKLKVTFFWPFYGDYWIIKLGDNYEYSVVGTPDREYLWILSRNPEMDNALFSELTHFAKSKGFDVANLIGTRQ
jgi:apolipoprotein D and lipocalin family protein